MRNIVGGSIVCSNNRRTCLLKFLIKVLNEKCHGYTHMLQDNPPYILATATATVVQLVTSCDEPNLVKLIKILTSGSVNFVLRSLDRLKQTARTDRLRDKLVDLRMRRRPN